jgi:hypothetical protein
MVQPTVNTGPRAQTPTPLPLGAEQLHTSRALPQPNSNCRNPLDPATQADLAERISRSWEGSITKPSHQELGQLTAAITAAAPKKIELHPALERALIRGLQWITVSAPFEAVLAHAQLSSDGLQLFAEAIWRQYPAARQLAFDLANNPEPQEGLFVGPVAEILFDSLTGFFYSPRGYDVEQALANHSGFINARLRYLITGARAKPSDEYLTALAETTLFLGRCLRRTVRCRSEATHDILKTHNLFEPLLEGTLRGATGRLGIFLRTISCFSPAAERITLLARKLPPEQLLPSIKQSLAAHLLRDGATI